MNRSTRPDDRRSDERNYESGRYGRGERELGYRGEGERYAPHGDEDWNPDWVGEQRSEGRRDDPARPSGFDYGYGRGTQHREPDAGSWRERLDSDRGYGREARRSTYAGYAGERQRPGGYGFGRNPQRSGYGPGYEGNWQQPGFSPGGYAQTPGEDRAFYGSWSHHGPAGAGRSAFQGYSGARGWEGGFSGRGPKGYKRSDERIREAVSERLEEADDVDASDMEVDISEGEVTLKGTVLSRWMKRCAEDCIADLPGVKDVNNQLRVKESAASTSGRSSDAGKGERSGSSSGAGQQSKSSARSSV